MKSLQNLSDKAAISLSVLCTIQSIPLEEIYQPVWVIGEIKVEKQKTELAEAGYIIQDAELEIYDYEKEKATQAW